MKMIAVDKIAHFCAGWAIAATAFIFVGGWPAILLAAISGAAISGAAKELLDKRTGKGNGQFNIVDVDNGRSKDIKGKGKRTRY